MQAVVKDREAGEHDKFGMDSKMEQAMKEEPNDLIVLVWVDHGDLDWGVLLLVQHQVEMIRLGLLLISRLWLFSKDSHLSSGSTWCPRP